MKNKIRSKITSSYTKINTSITKLGSDLVTHPIFGGLVIIITYFLLDNELMNKYDEVPDSLLYMGFLYAIGFLFIVYIHHAPYKTKRRKHIAYALTAIISLLVLAIIFFYEDIIPSVLPTLYGGYSKSQIVLLCLIAPILEELAYRYLLYGKWAQKKWGKWKGAILIGAIFVIMHPIINMSGFALYWLPTILFYIAYNEVGLYWSILVHITFNIIALL